jgi:ATP-binding cassette, subfamily B, vacuolar membrane transporter HMT1/ACLQ
MAGEGVELSSKSGPDGASTPAAILLLLDVVHFHYAWVLFVVFLAAFIANSILSAEPSSESKEPVLTGPGGKPLPRSTRKTKEECEKKKLKDFSPGRKLLFFYLSAGLLATFVANAANIVIHALTESENGWWCREATAVSGHSPKTLSESTLTSINYRYTFAVRPSSIAYS